MAAEAALAQRLLSATGVTALVGTRVEPLLLPDNASYPSVVYRTFDREPTSTFADDVALSATSIEVESYGTTYASARATADAVKSALQRWSGTVAGIVVDHVFYEDETADYDSEARVFVISQDYRLWTRER